MRLRPSLTGMACDDPLQTPVLRQCIAAAARGCLSIAR